MSVTKNPLYRIEPINPQPQILYNQALILCKQGDYENALQFFYKVQEMEPNFQYIGQNIYQCAYFCRVQKIYNQGLTLFEQENFLDAWKYFVYIETTLQSDFQDCLQKIEESYSKFYEQQVVQLLQKLELEKEQEQEKQRKLKEQQAKIQRMMKIKKKSVPLPENQQQQQPNQEQPVQIEQKVQEPEKKRQKIEKIQIYYTCTKDPKCENACIEYPINHLQCKTTAYLGADGFISCDSSCERYFITDALFSCEEKIVQRIDDTVDATKYERLDSLFSINDLNNDCLLKSQIYHDEDKDDFLLHFPIEEIMQKGVF